jgi:hypothetical protein
MERVLPGTKKGSSKGSPIVLKPGNKLALVRSAIPMGKTKGERIGFWNK